jgi:glucans biosynthesis protein
MYRRREFLQYALAGVATPVLAGVSAVSPALAQNGSPPPAEPSSAATETPVLKSFNAQSVTGLARELASRPYRAPSQELSDFFSKLDYEQYLEIRRKADRFIWRDDNIGFAIEPLHRGSIYSGQMLIDVVENGNDTRLAYRRDDYEFGKLKPPGEIGDIGFSGFRVLTNDGKGNFDEVASFQGACFYKALGEYQTPGITARALALRVGDPRGEEVPRLAAVWIEKPTRAKNALVIHALMDSPSLSGAFRFTLRPGEATIIDTECTLFTRVAIDHFGLGAMQATHLFGPMDRRRSEDLRPGVYEVTGLQILSGRKEWIWRPIANRETLQVSAFVDENPKGFGLIQRDRDFARFLDDDQLWNRRPSVWIEPLGEWGRGSVTLAEIPADSQVNQNIVAYYRPREPLAAGSETNFAYRQFWCWTPPERPPLAVTRYSRLGRIHGFSANSRRRRVLVEFEGNIFSEDRPEDIKPRISAYPGNISAVKTTLIKNRKAMRVQFDFDAGQSAQCELRLDLAVRDTPVTETWLYRWTA